MHNDVTMKERTLLIGQTETGATGAKSVEFVDSYDVSNLLTLYEEMSKNKNEFRTVWNLYGSYKCVLFC